MSFGKELIKVINDCLTNANGDYDPARVVGYGIVAIGGLQYLLFSAIFAIIDKKFDGIQFATGLAAIGGALAAAGVGVWVKRAAEDPAATTAKNPQ